MAFNAIGKEPVEPIEMICVTGQDSEDFQFKPAHAQRNRDDTRGKNDARGERVDAVLTDGDGEEGEQKSQPRDHL